MKYLNPRHIAYCNIDKWHSAGYQGEGIKVGVVEGGMSNYAKDNIYDGTVEDPFGLCRDSKASENNHMQNVVSVLHEVAPKATKVLLPSSFSAQDPYQKGDYLDGLQYAIDHGIDIITMSLGGSGSNSKARVEMEQKAVTQHNITLLVAAGNDGKKGVTPHAKLLHCVAVGNCRLPRDTNKPELHPTSSIGPEVAICGFGTLEVPVIKSKNTEKSVTGTSFASPWVAGILALLQESGRRTHQERLNFLQNNAEPLDTFGTGWGLAKLPTEIPEKPDDKEEDPQMEIREMQTPAVVKDGRFLVPVRDIIEVIGGTAHFDSKTKEGIFKINNTTIILRENDKNMKIIRG